jgi:SpoVK/Ycf46/Vps4 family AAA+-type ATPase
VTVGGARFIEIYRLATPEEIAKIRQVLPAFKRSGTAVTIDALNNIPDDGEVGSTPLSITEVGKQVGELITPDPNIHKIENMVLYPECVEAAMMGINQVRRGADIEEVFQISKVLPKAGRCAINLYGPPGTGKTMLALGIAQTLGKKLYKVDYSSMISKWVGDTGKNIKAAFTQAKAHDAILLFDEADSMLSKRLTITEDAVSNSVNQNRNILMQELDSYDGIVFFTTNKFENYDEALLRRIAAHVKFELPNEEMRVKLFEMHYTNHGRLKDLSFEECAKKAKDFSGGDILNVCVNSMRRCANVTPDKTSWYVTQDMADAEIKRVAQAKREHGGIRERKMGLAMAGD